MLRLVVFLLFLAAVLYALFWLLDQRSARSGTPRRGRGEPGGRTAPRGPVGPDDDDDFLRELDWKNRKRHEHDGDN